jgi:hypothetical protein
VGVVAVVTYRTEPDGTRVYPKGWRYKPLEDDERVYGRRKPADAIERGAVRFAGNWYYPLEVLPDEQRGRVPWTRPDEEAIEHQFGCLCHMCRTVPRVRRKKRARVLAAYRSQQ